MSSSSILVIASIIVLASLAIQTLGDAGAMADDNEDASWTIMVYMAADAEPELPWEEDINEMEGAVLSDKVEVIILVDPLGDNNTELLRSQHDELWNGEIVSEALEDEGAVISNGEVDMASPEVLTDFVTYAYESFPADRLALIVWGHGGGWLGICPDGTSVMSIEELGIALAQATERIGRTLDLILTDACVEGVIETMYQVREYADAYVGSEMLVPDTGFQYNDILSKLVEDTSQTPQEWGIEIAKDYVSSLVFSGWSAGMGVFDLRQMDGLVRAMDLFSKQAMICDPIYGNDMLSIIQTATDSDYNEWYKDVGNLFLAVHQSTLPAELRWLALDALLAYDRFVVYSDSHISADDDSQGLTGAAVFMPGVDAYDYGYDDLSFSSTYWDEMSIALFDTTEALENDGPIPAVRSDAMSTTTIEWVEGYEYYEAWVFVETAGGLQFWETIASYDPDLTIHGVGGALMISTWAGTGMRAEEHKVINVSVNCLVEVSAHLRPFDQEASGPIEVFAITSTGIYHFTEETGYCTLWLSVPNQASMGELIKVEVMDKETGSIIGRNMTYLDSDQITLDVTLWSPPSSDLGMQFYLPAIGLAVIAATAAIIIWFRKATDGRP